MKKIILTSALLAVCSANIYGNNLLPNMDNMYVKVEAFAGIGAQVAPSPNTYGETTFNGSVGVGFQAMEQVRAELLVSYLQGPEYSGVKMVSDGWVAFVNGYVEAVDLGSAKLAVGAGLGVSWLESEISSHTPSTADGKYANDFAFSWNIGANLSFEATPEAAIELSYRYANYGMPGSSDAATARAWDASEHLKGEARASHNIGLGLRFNM